MNVLMHSSCIKERMNLRCKLVMKLTYTSDLFLDQLLNLALVAGPQEQIDAARYFSSSERRQLPKAVMLYHKAGLLSKAVDLAFKSGQISAVGQIAGELDDSADPALIQRCAQYFISNAQYDRAVSLLITGRQVRIIVSLVNYSWVK